VKNPKRQASWLWSMSRAAVRTIRNRGVRVAARDVNRVVRREMGQRSRQANVSSPVERPSVVGRANVPSAEVTIRLATIQINAMHASLENVLVPIISPIVDPQDPNQAVAVVVPAFNAAEYLHDCLRSIENQTYSAWRCYIVDDASTDATASIAMEAARHDDRFVVLRHGRNSGLSAARNSGLCHATEPLVTFLDADDLLVPTSLQRRVAKIGVAGVADGIAGSWAATPLVPEETRLADASIMDRPKREHSVHVASTGGECPFNAHAPLLRTELIRSLGGFDERLREGAEDWDLWHRLLRHGYTLVNAGGLAGLYRQRRGSMVRRDQAGHLRVADRLLSAAESLALLDPTLTHDERAAAPLSRLKLAATRVSRLALSAGIQVGASADVESLDDSLWEFVDGLPSAVVEDLDLVDRVIAGIHRGLGLGTARNELDTDQAAKIEDVATWIAGEIARRVAAAPLRGGIADSEVVDCRPLLSEPDVLVVAETSADVVALGALVSRLSAEGSHVAVLDVDGQKGDEGATAAWQQRGFSPVSYNHVRLGRVLPSTLLVRRPVGPVTAELAAACKASGAFIMALAEEPRDIRLDCDESESLEVDGELAATGLSAVDDTNPLLAKGREIRPLRRVRGFSSKLVREEGELDPASTKLLEDVRDRHRGESVVVVGNGPSLNETDLSLLSGVPTFAVNGIFYGKERFPDPIKYYVVEDTSVFRENTEEIKQFETGHKFFPTIYQSSFTERELNERIGFFRMNVGFYGRETGTVCHPRFSTDATQRLFCGQSVTIINLQLAYWMGFERVVLIGMDFSYTIPEDVDRKGDVLTSNSDDVNHFHKDYFGKGKTWKDPKLDRVLANYALARDMFQADGREIINATVGGNLELYPRLTLAEALQPEIGPSRIGSG
jgi:hypothetical protein